MMTPAYLIVTLNIILFSCKEVFISLRCENLKKMAVAFLMKTPIAYYHSQRPPNNITEVRLITFRWIAE